MTPLMPKKHLKNKSAITSSSANNISEVKLKMALHFLKVFWMIQLQFA